MDPRGDRRPPRAARPQSQQPHSRSPAPYPDQPPSQQPQRPQQQQGQQRDQNRYSSSNPASPRQPPYDAQRGVSFQNVDMPDPNRARHMGSAYQRQMPPPHGVGAGSGHGDPEAGEYFDPSKVGRKKSLVRPDREKIDPSHRQFHYRSHVQQAEEDGRHRIGVMPSTTGNQPHSEGLRRGRSLLGREQDQHESHLQIFKRGTLRRRKSAPEQGAVPLPDSPPKKRGCWRGPGPGGPWMTYCVIVTCWAPSFFLKAIGLGTPERQRAWREKMGLLSLILILMAGVGFLTFGFTEAVCSTPPNRFHGGAIGDTYIGNSSVVINGYDYDFSKFNHPKAGSTFNGTSNPVLTGGWNLGGNDASFLFQKTNQNCLNVIKKSSRSSITGSGLNLDWYFPCNIYSQYGNQAANLTGYETSTTCHLSNTARLGKNGLAGARPQGQVYFTWDDVHSPKRNLAVYESTVLDLNKLNWLNRAQVDYPALFDEMKNPNGTYNGKDLTMLFMRTNNQQLGHCLQDIISVGFIDTNSIGCVASSVVLYLSLIFIIGVVAIRFVMAVLFAWFFSWKLGNFQRETYEQRMARSAEIENWSSDIYRPAPGEYRPNVNKKGLTSEKRKTAFGLPSYSRFTPSENAPGGVNASGRPVTTYGNLDTNWKRTTVYSSNGKGGSKVGSEPSSKSSMSLPETPCPFPLNNVVPQPGPDHQEPFGFPLAHTICLVTAYSESVEGLRTTLDSLATTDYPNSHKLILVIADGMVKGAGNDLTTPEIVLTMMKEFVIHPDEVEPHSYVAIADGHKRHNMAKVFAGFYAYDDNTVERSKQQRVPIVLVAKCGNPLEVNDAKPGNRGKRDSQIVLMSFLQKVMFDERMTTFEYEFFNSIWRATGISPDRYELLLCVDADTKVFPDSLTRMISCMVHDEEIMGLCGETKIANKAETFITMIQVFEYYISHHLTKAFESMFGGVTCLPGCFSMYRIKAPKGDSGYWVPILANPDIVEHYSENVVDTLHKKNLLLLGEDRYLTTLMLKTFPKRKNMFCPQAVCKTIVPDTFPVLLSQRRRWINSTIHNLAELVLVRDLCGTFCFSMQFIVGIELAGTLVLPAAISFTFYLIIQAIIPGGPNTTIPLVLLAIILGLPGLLIVVTSRKVAYIGWMLVYLLSLPIWNGILPAYAFWHFDDFSWGQTRKIEGDKGDDHGDKEGEFDSSHIVMKRWAEFERDRRWKAGVQSRDSTYYDKKAESNRYSMASNSDTTHPMPNSGYDGSTMETSFNNGARPRHDSSALLMLPAPLSVSRQQMSSTSTVGRTSEDNYLSDSASYTNQRLIPSPGSMDQESYESGGQRSTPSHGGRYDPSPRVMSPASPAVSDPFRNSMASPPTSYEDTPFIPDYGDNAASSRRASARGFSLTDGGPVPGPEGVRRVSRQAARRPSSQVPQQQPQNRYSRSSTGYGLPPGAAPPQPYTGSNHGSNHGHGNS